MTKKNKPKGRGPERIEFSVILPCLNEAATVGRCVAKAHQAIRKLGLRGEVLVADNGSRDASARIARQAGARVVSVKERGYGSALRGGMAAARGSFFLMADADDSYDLASLGPFVEKMRAGSEMVIGNRFQGGIAPGAMPWKNQWIGNPALTFSCRLLFSVPLGDVCCGFRALSKQAFGKLKFQTTGMEFAVEMIVQGKKAGLRVAEVPVTLQKDGRSGPSHLRGWRDGMVHLLWMLAARIRGK